MNTRIKIELEGVSYNDHIPEFSIDYDNTQIATGFITDKITFNIHTKDVPGVYKLNVKFLNKTDDDTKITDDGFFDKAIKVNRIWFNDIECPECLLDSVYKSDDGKKLKGNNYISWNGVWSLEISIPVFTYMFHKKNLGWIYNIT